MKKIILLLLLASFSGLFAQSGNVAGKISDENNFTLAGANVYIRDLDRGTSSDNQGYFSMLRVPEGTYMVTVSYIGFQSVTEEVVVTSNKTTEFSVVLKSGVLEGDEIIVIGERLKGQAKALNQQRENVNITNVVSSDQIGRFPDANIGDALKRIPSITVNYDQGEARFVNIRGTEPRFNSIMINGERVPSAEGEIRSVQVDLVPAEAIQTIEVNKAVTPDMDADAIGGAVNLITRAASEGLRVSGTLGSGINFLSNQPIWIGSAVLSQRFFDNKLGVVLSGSYHDHNLGSDNTEGSWISDNMIEEWEVRKYDIRRMRQSFSAAVDYRIDINNVLRLKAIYNHRNDWENRFALTYGDIEEDDGVYIATFERELKGGIDNDDNMSRRLEDQRAHTLSLGGEHLLGNFAKLNWSGAWSKASEERPNERYINWRVKDVPVNIDLSDQEKPMVTAVNPDDVDPSQFELKEISEEYQFTQEIDLNGKIDLEIPLTTEGMYKNALKVGGRYRGKEKNRANNFFEYSPVSGMEVMSDGKYFDVSDSDFLAGNYLIGNFSTPDYLGNLDLKNSNLFEEEDLPGEYAADNYEAEEKIIAGYAMFTQNIGKEWDIIGGVRIENTSVEYTGNQYNENDDSAIPVTGDDSYTNFLPGLHINYRYNPNTIFRFAWTNTIARPNYYDLVPYRAIGEGEDNVFEEIAIGNPSLQPTTSMNFDLMVENYYQNIGLISGGLFFKKISDYIYVEERNDVVENGNLYEEYFQPKNGAEASLFGIELAFQRRLDFMPSVFKNLDLYLNYTFTTSSTDNPTFPDRDIELPGSAPHTLNANLTYQDERLVLGVSFNYTAPYLDSDDLILTEGLERYYDTVTYLDLNGAFAFTPQLRFFFEVNNLLNQPLRYYAGDSGRTYQAEYYNVRFNAGIKFDL